MKKLVYALACFLLLTHFLSAQPPSDARLRSKVFETVWSTINKTFYDAGFNGVDWKATRTKYAALTASAKTEEEFYKLLNEMLGLLKVSHLEAGPASEVKKLTQKVSTMGIGMRTVDGKPTVTRVIPGFPAEAAGIKLGYIITAVDGTPVADVDAARSKLSGMPETSVKITYLDERDVQHDATVRRQELSEDDRGKIAGLKFYALFDSKMLDSDIGYISFTSFVPFLNDRIHEAITSMKDARGLILDLRGNGGGDDSVAIGIANRLFDEPTLLMITKRRKADDLYYKAKPTKPIYHGKMVVLVDELSESASEQLTAGLQEIGRVYVIGKKSPGSDLDANIQVLPDGGLLVYAYGLPRTPKGVVVEGRGIIPDLGVELHRADLLAGRDAQLQAAIDYLTPKNH